MKITLKTIDKKMYTIEADPATTTTDQLRALIESEHGFDASLQQLIHVGKVLKEPADFTNSNYKEDQFLVLLMQKAKAKPAAAPAAAPAPAPAAPPAEPTPAPATPMEQDTPAEPAAAPAPSEPAAPESAGMDVSEAEAGLVNGPEYESTVKNLMDMGFPEDQVKAAMSAAFNNPERAVEYLFDPSSMPVAAAPAPAGVPPANPAAGLPANPAAGGIPANPAAGGDPAAALPPDLQALMADPQFMQMIAALNANPDMLQPVLQNLQQTNPELMQTIMQNQGAFMALLGAGAAGGMGGQAPGGGGEGGAPPGAIRITPEERAAIDRIKAVMGPSMDDAIIYQTLKACDGNEELTMNLLMDQM